MPQLSGALQGIGLLALLRFLGDLRATGRLRVAADPWAGEVILADGRVVGATFGAERGLVALEAIMLTLAGGTFQVTDEAPPEARESGRDDQLAAGPVEELVAHLEQVARDHGDATAVLLAPSAILSVTEPVAPAPGEEPDDAAESLTMTRNALGVFLAIQRGQQSLASLAAARGLFPAIQALAELHRLGLIHVAVPAGEPDVPPDVWPDASPATAPRF